MQTPADRSWVAFKLRPEARWHDGKPITADDVVWSFETLLAKGAPLLSLLLPERREGREDRRAQRQVQLQAGHNRELPLIVGQLPVLPKHYGRRATSSKPTLEPPLGSGPYKVGNFEAGRSIELERVPDYWGKDLPVNAAATTSTCSASTTTATTTVALEAFKGGDYDFRAENVRQGLGDRLRHPRSAATAAS